jgi:hypothetical protein
MRKSVLAILTVALLCAPLLRAATITVSSTGDTIATDGLATLREAITSIDNGADVNGDVTVNRTGSYGTSDAIDLTGVTGTITLTSALPSLTKSVTITGPGAANLTISGNDLYRVFFVTNGATVSISDLTIAHGKSSGGNGGNSDSAGGGGGGAGMGAGLFVSGSSSVTATNVTFSSNSVSGGTGGVASVSGSFGGSGGGGGIDANNGTSADGAGNGGKGGGGGVLGGTGGAGGGYGSFCAGSTNGGNGTADGAGGGGAPGCDGSSGGTGSFGGGDGGSQGCCSQIGIGGHGGGGTAGTNSLGGGGGFGCLSNSPGGGGGAGMGGSVFVRSGSSLSISSCTFSSNQANGGAGGDQGTCWGGGAGKGKGGAIFVDTGATLTVTCPSDLAFSGNSASDAGSATTNPQDNKDVYGTVTSLDTTDPVITCPADQLNIPNDAGLCSAAVDPGTATATDDCAVASIEGVRSDAAALTDPYPVGSTTITWTATDTSGNTAQCTQTISVVDNEKPVVSSSVSVGVLTNDHTMRNVGFTESATDNCGGNLTNSATIEIYSSEQEQAPTSTGGDGTTSPDARGRGTCYNSGIWVNKIGLRQERLNNGSGRIYLIKTSATDASNNTGWSCATVVSPRSNKKNDINKVLAAASAVNTVCNQFGAIPTNYYLIGCGPVIGSKQ